MGGIRAPILRGLGSPFGGAVTALAVTERVLFHWQDTPSVKNQRFLPPPSKREARKRQIPVFLTTYGRGAQRMHKEAPAFVTHCQRRLAAGRGVRYPPSVRDALAGRPAARIVSGGSLPNSRKPCHPEHSVSDFGFHDCRWQSYLRKMRSSFDSLSLLRRTAFLKCLY